MGILGRINRVVKASVNDLLDKMTDPAKEVDLLIAEMEDGARQARAEVVTAVAGVKQAEQQDRELEERVAQWGRRAEQAVRAGDDGLAREALAQRLAAEQERESMRAVLAERQQYAEELKRSLAALEAKVKEVQARRGTLKAQARAAKKGEGALPGRQAFDKFAELEARIEAMEAAGSVEESLGRADAATEAKFQKLTKDQPNAKVEDDLLELKRRLEQEKK